MVRRARPSRWVAVSDEAARGPAIPRREVHEGRQWAPFVIVKAGVAAATTTKLLKNATANAKTDPTLCKTVTGPLTTLSTSLGGVVSSLKSGSLNTGALSGITGLLSTIKNGASKAGVPVTEQQITKRASPP
jgi:hypothetical protein